MEGSYRNQSEIDGHFNGNNAYHSTFGNGNTTNNGRITNKVYLFAQRSKEYTPHPLIWMVPYCRNPDFIGRKSVIKRMNEISEGQGHNRIALYGLGGAGKTGLALEYAYQWKDRCHVFWVHGSSMLKFREDYRRILHRIRGYPPHDREEGQLLLEVKEWLESNDSGEWVLVLDNADDEFQSSDQQSTISKFLPYSAHGTVIITTRSLRFAHTEASRNIIHIRCMERQEALELFLQRMAILSDLEVREEKDIIWLLLESLEYLPLAIVGATAYMNENNVSVSEYWSIFGENDEARKKLLSTRFRDIYRKADMTESVLNTYFVTFRRLMQQMPIALDLLKLMAFFDRQNMPEQLLLRCGLNGMDDNVGFRNTVGSLLGLSLVTKVIIPGKAPIYELHGLVQMSIQVYLTEKQSKDWNSKALSILVELFPEFKQSRKAICTTYLPHARAVVRGVKGSTANLMNYRVALCLGKMGYLDDAEKQIRMCIPARPDEYTPLWGGEEFDVHYWRRVEFLGTLLLRLGKYDDAERVYWSVLTGRGELLGLENPETLVSLSGLASVLRHRNRNRQAFYLSRLAVEGNERVLGPDHINTLGSVDNLGSVLRCLRYYDEAEKNHRRALKGRQDALGLNHPDTLASADNLASVLRCQGKLVEAEAICRRVLAALENVQGRDHPNTLASVKNLASVLQELQKWDEAKAMSRRALDGLSRALGPNHPAALASARALASILSRQENHQEVEATKSCAGKTSKQRLGPAYWHLTSIDIFHGLWTEEWSEWGCSRAEMNAFQQRVAKLGLIRPHTCILTSSPPSRGVFIKAEVIYHQAVGINKQIPKLDKRYTVSQDPERVDRGKDQRRRALGHTEDFAGPSTFPISYATIRTGKPSLPAGYPEISNQPRQTRRDSHMSIMNLRLSDKPLHL